MAQVGHSAVIVARGGVALIHRRFTIGSPALAFVLAACAPAPVETPYLDLLAWEGAQFTSPIPRGTVLESLTSRAEMLVSEPFGAEGATWGTLAPSDAATILGIPGTGRAFHLPTGKSHELHIEGPAVLGRITPAAAEAKLVVRLRVTGDIASILAAVVLLENASVREGEVAQSVLRHLGENRLVELAPAGDGILQAAVSTNSKTRALAILCGVTRGKIVLGHVSVSREPGALSSVRPDTGHGRDARVCLRRDDRTALLVAAPAALRARISVPTQHPRLRVAAAWLDGASHVEVTIDLQSEGIKLVDRLLLEREASPRWKELELELDALSGRGADVVITFTSNQQDARAPAIAALATIAITGEPPVTNPRPDVVLISLDTVRADRLSVYGYQRETTPALQRLASDAAVFENAIAPAPWTLPSHVSLFTGQLPDRHGVTRTDRRPADDAPLIATELRASGYRTLAFTGGGYMDSEFGLARGFERWYAADPGAERARAIPEAIPAREQVLDAITDIDSRPLFLFLHTYAAHNYMALPQDLRAVGAPPHRVEALLQGTNQVALRRRLAELHDSKREALGSDISYVYDATLRQADRFVGDVVSALRAANRIERTILIVTSDHGEELLDHGDFGHGASLYEELVRVPLIVRGPGIVPGRRTDVVSIADLAPTLRSRLELGPALAPVDGRDLSMLLAGRPLAPAPALARADLSGRVTIHALRGRREKLIVSAAEDRSPIRLLFDLEIDPLEQHDVSSERPQRTEFLHEALLNHVAQVTAARARAPQVDTPATIAAELEQLGYTAGGD